MIELATAEREAALALFDLAGAAAAIDAAHRAGLVAALREESGTAAEHARRLGLDPRATAGVLDVLVAYGFARRDDEGCYAASAAALAMDDIFPGGFEFAARLWSHVPEFLAGGTPRVSYDGAAAQREETYRDTVGGLARLFSPPAAELAARLPRRSRILDVGAGSGVWSLTMAELDADAHVTALDLPAVAEVFLEHAAQRGLAARVATLSGDFHEVELPAGAFDRVVLANVIHLEPPDGARRLIARAAAAVRPGGDLVVVEPVLGGSAERDRAAAIYALHLVMRTDRGRAHSLPEINGWLEEAGLTPQEPVALEQPAGALVAAVGRAPG